MCESDLVTPGIKPDEGVSEFWERFETYSQNMYISLKMKKKTKMKMIKMKTPISCLLVFIVFKMI